MKTQKARIGLIGCGRIAREGHLPYLKENPNAEIVAVMDICEKNRESIKKEFGIPQIFGDAESFFAGADMDGVLICTPNWIHKSLTLMAAERGIHVFCEKPMAVTVAECEEMIAACEKAGVTLQLGMAKRFDQGLVKVRKMIEAGDLGSVSQISTSCFNPPTPRLDSGLFETAQKWAAPFGIDLMEKLGLWRMTDERTGGGLLLEMGTHLLDMILYFTNEEPSSWSGYINRNRPDLRWEDQGVLLMKFASGVIASAEMNMSVTADNLIGEKGKIFGDKASIAFNLINGMWFGLPFYHYIPTLLSMNGPLSPMTGLGLPVPIFNVGKKVYMYKRQMDYFVDGILGRDRDYFGFGQDFASDGKNGLAVMRVIEDVYLSDKCSCR